MKKYLILVLFFLMLGLITEPSIVRAEDGDSLTGTMREFSSSNTPDKEVMETTGNTITSKAGVVISVIIYIFFALIGFTTACDLLYIAVPPIRPLLYSKGNNNSQSQGFNNQGGNNNGINL